MLQACYDAKKIIEEMPVAQTRLLCDEKFDRDTLVWAVPEWFGKKPTVEHPGPEQMRDAEERAREMRLYALRMPLMREPRKIEWLD